MNQIYIEFKTIEDFIPSLAEEFKIGFKRELGEYSILIPQDRGEGFIKGIQFPNGLALYNFSCTFKEKTEICIKHLIVNPVKIVQCMEGRLQSSIKNEKNNHYLAPHQYTIISPRLNENHRLLFEKGVQYEMSYLEIDRKVYMKGLPFEISDTNPLFYDLFHNSHVLDGHLLPSSYNISTSEIMKEIWNCELKGLPRINFLGAKVLEMLSATLETYKQDVIHDRRQGLTEEEYHAVSIVANEINTNLTERKKNSELAERVSMSVNNLQKCFQQVYGKTVTEYIRDVRLSRALELLQTKEKNISEVVSAIGLNSHSYFSQMFKEKYGISPRDILNSNNNSAEFSKLTEIMK